MSRMIILTEADLRKVVTLDAGAVACVEDAFRALLEDGALLLSTNDRGVPVPEVAAAVERGAKAAGRRLREVREVPLGPDLPAFAPDPSLRPMRGVCAILAG